MGTDGDEYGKGGGLNDGEGNDEGEDGLLAEDSDEADGVEVFQY